MSGRDKPETWPAAAAASGESRVMTTTRFIIAALIAPLIPGLLAALPDLLAGESGMAMWYIGFSAVAGYISLVVVGIPIFLLLRMKKVLGFLDFTIVGFVCGVAVFFGAFLPGMIADAQAARAGLVSSLAFLPLAALFGAIGGSVFWLIAQAGGSQGQSAKN
jgi:hypothetical protein